MERSSGPALHPALLPPGTVVGGWRVVAWAGSGVHGAVYRAERVDAEQGGPVALKVALLPRDPRFAREGAVLSRCHHPSIPRLLDSGEWQHPGGTLHPYAVMEWVDGVPLYDWAREHNPDSQQVLRLLAQLASALEALHAQGAIHRDVKGGNVLVRRTDGRAVLTDFGSGSYTGAATLTPPGWLPGTPAYRSPEAWLFELQSMSDPSARYRAGPADDLYALGVTGCRLVTGEYPEPAAPIQDEHGNWRLESVIHPPALQHDPRVKPQLRALLLRMLAIPPDERGTAMELAEALEQAAQPTVAAGPQPILASAAPVARLPEQAPATQVPRLIRPRARTWHGRSWLAVGAVLALAVWTWWVAPGPRVAKPSVAPVDAAEAGRDDADATRLGDAATSTDSRLAPVASKGMAEDAPPEPLPGQTRPDAKGHCPHKRQTSLNKGCWLEIVLDREACEVSGGSTFKGKCYMPIVLRHRLPNSSPTDNQ